MPFLKGRLYPKDLMIVIIARASKTIKPSVPQKAQINQPGFISPRNEMKSEKENPSCEVTAQMVRAAIATKTIDQISLVFRLPFFFSFVAS